MLLNLLRYNPLIKHALARPIIVSRPHLKSTVFSKMTTSAPAEAPVTGAEPNLQKDPVTGEMISKRRAHSRAFSLTSRNLIFLFFPRLVSNTVNSRNVSRLDKRLKRRPSRCVALQIGMIQSSNLTN
jgi:hypothetical protein